MSVIYTSGTTGLAKGVLRDAMTPEQSQQVAAVTLAAMGLRPGMRTLITAPMYHAAPNSQALFSLALGIELTIMPRFEPEEFLALVQSQRITHAQTVPTMFVRLLELPDEVRARYDVSSLECVVHAAAPCPVHVKRRMIEWFGPVIFEYYGATEIGIVVACDSHEWLAHEGTVGRPLADADIHVFDPAGELLAPGETGEVYIRPPGYWPGFTYLDQEDRRREIDRDGYITIGDIGRVDEDGFLHLSDRARDMVISGGVNIYPAEIEACLLELEGVRDVAVFGIPDDDFGEALAAHVDADPSAGLTDDRRARSRRRPAGRIQGAEGRRVRRRPTARGDRQDLQAPDPRALLAGRRAHHLTRVWSRQRDDGPPGKRFARAAREQGRRVRASVCRGADRRRRDRRRDHDPRGDGRQADRGRDR